MSELLPLRFQSLPGTELQLQPPTLFKGVQILHNGTPLQRRWGKFVLPTADGERVITIKGGLDAMAPRLVLDGEILTPIEPLPTWMLVLALVPFGLVGVGGLIGGLLGGAAWGVNLLILRTSLPAPVRILMVLGCSAVAVGLWLVVALVLFG